MRFLILLYFMSSCTQVVTFSHWERCIKYCKEMNGLKEAGGYDYWPFTHMCCRCNDGTKVELYELVNQPHEEDLDETDFEGDEE